MLPSLWIVATNHLMRWPEISPFVTRIYSLLNVISLPITMKTKIFSYILLISVLFFPMQSCMQWNGDIGDWFGSWHLESMYIDGEQDTGYKGDIMVSFQGKIVNLAYMEVGEIYAAWSYAGMTLTLIAGYEAGSGASMPSRFDPFPIALHFPKGEDMVEVVVTSMTNKSMQWQYIDAQGQLITYNFKKYP